MEAGAEKSRGLLRNLNIRIITVNLDRFMVNAGRLL